MNSTFSSASAYPVQSNEYKENITAPYTRWMQADWIIPEVLNGVLILLTLWIIYSLIYFGIKSRKWDNSYQQNYDKLSGGFVYTSTIICAVMVLLRLITSQATMNVGFSEGQDRDCEKASDAVFIMYALSLFSVYIFLWLRQGVFYANNMLKVQFSVTVRVFSVLSIAVIVAAGLGVIFFNTFSDTFHSSRTGCRYIPPDESFDAINQISCSALVLGGQLMLVGLFIYPLVKSQSWKDIFCHSKPSKTLAEIQKPRLHPHDVAVIEISSVSTQSEDKTLTRKTNKNKNKSVKKRASSRALTKIMFRTIVFSVLSIVTEISILVLTRNIFDGASHRRLSNLVYDINSFLNLLFVIGSFLSYKEMLLSPLLKKKCRKRSYSGSAFSV